jgi:hypothetical protein
MLLNAPVALVANINIGIGAIIFTGRSCPLEDKVVTAITSAAIRGLWQSW